MTDQLTGTTERVDDLPILLTQSDDMGIPELLDEYFKPHGNWEGMSLAGLDNSDQQVHQRWWSDDRLALILDALAQPEVWQRFETALNQRIIRVYQLNPQRVRLDSTTASGYWTVSEEGLFQLGYSKDHRPDLPQLKVMLSALDPLGLPVATQIVSGQRADDRLYLPAIAQVSQSLDEHGLLYVGDGKMAALETRAYLEAQQDFYLCPLSSKQLPDEVLEEYLQPVWVGEQALTAVSREQEAGKPE